MPAAQKENQSPSSLEVQQVVLLSALLPAAAREQVLEHWQAAALDLYTIASHTTIDKPINECLGQAAACPSANLPRPAILPPANPSRLRAPFQWYKVKR